MRHTIVPWMILALAACSTPHPPRDTSTPDRIIEHLKQAAAADAKPAEKLPDAVSTSLLPPLKAPVAKVSPRQLEQRFDLVVNDTPINLVLMGIVSGTRYSILLKSKGMPPLPPANAGGMSQATQAVAAGLDRVSVNLRNVTVFDALDAIREMYGYDYVIEGDRIYVQQPELLTSFYQVNYIIGQRRGVSDLRVIGGASVGASSASGTSSSSSTSTSTSGNMTTNYSSVQASALSTISKSDLWAEIEDMLRTVLGCQIPKKMQSQSGASSSSVATTSGSSAGSSRADVSFLGDPPTGERLRGVDGCADGRAMAINQLSGMILVRGMPKEHRLIKKMLEAMQLTVERQAMLEAKIIEVTLSSDAQAGINWSSFNTVSNGFTQFGFVSPGTSLNALQPNNVSRTLSDSEGNQFNPGKGGSVVAAALGKGMFGMALQTANFAALLNFLQTQGQVHVLSSPRIATLNNQKAVIKVGSEEPFVTNINPGTAAVGGTGAAIAIDPTPVYQPFFSGISLDVTPQIDPNDNITLHVHSMVNSIIEKTKTSGFRTDSVGVPFAVNTISETDSVIKTRDGQVVVIGGLMTESAEDSNARVPGVGDAPGVGALFRKGGSKTVKRELVILLKPVIVKDGNAWANDITATQGRIENMERGLPVPADRQ